MTADDDIQQFGASGVYKWRCPDCRRWHYGALKKTVRESKEQHDCSESRRNGFRRRQPEVENPR